MVEQREIVKFRIEVYDRKGKRTKTLLIPVETWREGKRICLQWGWSNQPWFDKIKEEVKAMQACKWHGADPDDGRKIWSVLDSPRNRFQIDYLTGGNPYGIYDQPLIDLEIKQRLCPRC